MFTDPLSLTINGVASSLPRISQETAKGTITSLYQNSDETLKVTISHQKTGAGRIRSVVRVDQRKIVTSPLDSSSSDYDTLSCYTVFERPEYGFSQLEMQYLETALEGLIDNTAIGKLYGRES